jgi:hypothetical protein
MGRMQTFGEEGEVEVTSVTEKTMSKGTEAMH